MTSLAAAKEFSKPVPTRWSEHRIEWTAEEIAKAFEFKPGNEIRKLATDKLGGTIVVDDWRSPAPTGMIQVRGSADFTIWLSPFTGPARDVFTIAHELGHYFLHSRMGERRIEVKREGESLVEWEANCFAAALLLPRLAFQKAWERRSGDVNWLAADFGVSASVVSIRAKRIGLVNEL